MFDLTRTKSLIVGGLLHHKQTWQSYLNDNHSWQETAMLITVPMIVASTLLSAVLNWLFSNFYLIGFMSIVLHLVAAMLSIAIASFVFSFLADHFKGKQDFNKGFAAISLASIPAYIGNVIGTLPWIGWLVYFALGIFSLVLLYKILPSYLKIPEDKRVLHFIVSLIVTIVLTFILGMILGVGAYNAGSQNNNNVTSSSGLLGGLERQANIAEQAKNDRFVAPPDSKITEKQIATLIINLKKTADYRTIQADKLENLDEQIKDKKDVSFADIGKLTSGFTSVMNIANAEMEVVKTGGGNWAEHQWVKDQLLIARIQKDLNESVIHNYGLYQKYKDQLNDL